MVVPLPTRSDGGWKPVAPPLNQTGPELDSLGILYAVARRSNEDDETSPAKTGVRACPSRKEVRRKGASLMIAAIYARKSTEQNGVADEAKSVVRQIEHARLYANDKSWSVDERFIYIDDGISGAEFARRPGFLRLMNALKPRAPFDVLIMSEESRLGREAIETAYSFKKIMDAGVRVFFYLENRERTLDNPMDKFMLSVTSFADELERVKARQRTYDAMKSRAEKGYVTGGKVFGYLNHRTDAGVHRVINEAEAAVVRRIFELASQGYGLTRIGKLLNDEGAISPRAQRGRPNGWATSSVREALHRELYRGEIVWNQTRKRDRWGKKISHAEGNSSQRIKPESEWLRRSAPELQIVSDELWQRAHRMMTAARVRYGGDVRSQRTRGLVPGAPAKFLMTGLLRCGVCQAGIEARSRSHGKVREYFYGCSAFARKGKTICPNGLTVPMQETEERIIECLKKELLDADVIQAAVEQVASEVSCGSSTSPDAARRELGQLEGQIVRLVSAIAMAGDVPSLAAALRERETRKRELCRQLESFPTLDVKVQDKSAVVARLREFVDDWETTLRRNVQDARRMLQSLLIGRIVLTPGEQQAQPGYHFKGLGTVEEILAGFVHKSWRPQRDSNPCFGLERATS